VLLATWFFLTVATPPKSVPLADVPKYKAMIGHAIVTVSDLLELVGRGLDRGAVTTNRRTLNHRAPHRKSKGVVAAW
jgi:hypothetical protein